MHVSGMFKVSLPFTSPMNRLYGNQTEELYCSLYSRGTYIPIRYSIQNPIHYHSDQQQKLTKTQITFVTLKKKNYRISGRVQLSTEIKGQPTSLGANLNVKCLPFLPFQPWHHESHSAIQIGLSVHVHIFQIHM